MNWIEKYTAYVKDGFNAIYGDWSQTVVVSTRTGNVIGHLWGWKDPTVQQDWNPKRNGFAGKAWKTVRPKGWRKARNQHEILDWAVEAIAEW